MKFGEPLLIVAVVTALKMHEPIAETRVDDFAGGNTRANVADMPRCLDTQRVDGTSAFFLLT